MSPSGGGGRNKEGEDEEEEESKGRRGFCDMLRGQVYSLPGAYVFLN